MVYLIDTSIFLEVELKQEKKDEAHEFLLKVLKNEIKCITTDFNIDSAVIIMRNKKAKLADIKKFLVGLVAYEGLTIYEVNLIDRILATKTMEKFKRRYDDALNYFVMKSLGIKEIVSFDRDYDGLPNIKRVEPADALEKLKAKKPIQEEKEDESDKKNELSKNNNLSQR